jgi:probable phosphoglycerate mutase
MRLIFIRHGDPDYKHDTITEKGKREVELLTKRVAKWKNIAKIYISPMGRAQATAAPSLKALGMDAVTCEWLQEFYYHTTYPLDVKDKTKAGKSTMCWDLMPEYFFSDKDFFNKDKWMRTDFMKGGDIASKYKMVCDGIDGVLAEYGYIRNEQGFYDVKEPVPNHNWSEPIDRYHLKSVKDDYPEEKTLVFFCHLGVMFTMIAHFVGLSPMQLWQGFFVAPTSVTVVNSEERLPGQAFFRVERLGDVNHLINGGEPISSSGYFADVLSE